MRCSNISPGKKTMNSQVLDRKTKNTRLSEFCNPVHLLKVNDRFKNRSNAVVGVFLQRLFICIILSLLCQSKAFSQTADTIRIIRNDTIIEFIRPGTTGKKLEGRKLEDILQNYSERSILQKKLHEWLVKSNQEDSTRKNSGDQDNNFSTYYGKKVVNVDIRRIQPFGGSVYDTTAVYDFWLANLGNKLRFETASGIILRTITIEKDKPLKKTDIHDSERLLRALSFINDARVVAWTSPAQEDAVNISIYVQDRYPHAVSVGLHDQQPTFSLINENMLGRGISLRHTIVTPSSDIRDWGFRETIGAENFPGKYVNVELDYSHTDNLQLLGGKVQKDFVLPEIKYAGGINVNRSFINSSIQEYPSVGWDPPLDFSRQNYWFGRSFLLNKKGIPLRSNIYFTARYLDLTLFNKNEYSNLLPEGKFYCGSIAISQRGYYKNNLIYSFGRTEDVPFGLLSALAFGYHKGPVKNRHYLSFHYSWGKALIPSKGYLYLSGDIGSFFHEGSAEQGFVKVSGEYISPLINFGTGKLRNFFTAEYVNGLKRLPGEYLYIDENVNGLHRFDYKEKIKGSEKVVLKTEQVFFTRIQPLGFKFAFFTFFDTAFLKESDNGLFDRAPYYSFGCGLRIRNDHMVFNTLQISLAIIPRVPPEELPFSTRVTGETTRDFKDFIPPQPGAPVFY
jgi:hypothetical protein